MFLSTILEKFERFSNIFLRKSGYFFYKVYYNNDNKCTHYFQLCVSPALAVTFIFMCIVF